MKRFMCPVCCWPNLTEMPRYAGGGGSYEICPSCGFEFGYTDDDQGFTYHQWREAWVSQGLPWRDSFQPPPKDWNARAQLAVAGLPLSAECELALDDLIVRYPEVLAVVDLHRHQNEGKVLPLLLLMDIAYWISMRARTDRPFVQGLLAYLARCHPNCRLLELIANEGVVVAD